MEIGDRHLMVQGTPARVAWTDTATITLCTSMSTAWVMRTRKMRSLLVFSSKRWLPRQTRKATTTPRRKIVRTSGTSMEAGTRTMWQRSMRSKSRESCHLEHFPPRVRLPMCRLNIAQRSKAAVSADPVATPGWREPSPSNRRPALVTPERKALGREGPVTRGQQSRTAVTQLGNVS